MIRNLLKVVRHIINLIEGIEASTKDECECKELAHYISKLLKAYNINEN